MSSFLNQEIHFLSFFFRSRVKQLEVEVLQVGNLLRTMEISEDKASQRDGETTAKITAISAQLEEVSAKAEKFEEKSSGLDHQIDELEGKAVLKNK